MDYASFLISTRARSPELGDYLMAVASSPLQFEGEHPLVHSSYNHVHLWKLEYLADTCDWIDTAFRTAFAKYVLEQWRQRAKGLAPYRQHGYRQYVYEDLAPTLSMVAETDVGFPYDPRSVQEVKQVEDVMLVYQERSWRAHFSDDGDAIRPERVLNTIRRQQGSLSSGSASKLGLNVAQLRRLIVNLDLAYEVNAIRKHFRRRPADFNPPAEADDSRKLWERRLVAGYD